MAKYKVDEEEYQTDIYGLRIKECKDNCETFILEPIGKSWDDFFEKDTKWKKGKKKSVTIKIQEKKQMIVEEFKYTAEIKITDSKTKKKIKSTYNNKVLQLKANPIFNMSLSSKELFHSNFWAWLFEKDNNFIEIFFPKFLDKNKVTKVTREEKNRDITIWAKNENDELKAYVIENKFKAIPQKEQLKNYETGLGDKIFEKGILTGNDDKKPYFMGTDGEEEIKWDYISYNKIAEELNKRTSSKMNSFEKCLIDKYASMLSMLTDYINNYSSSKKIWEWETDSDSKMIKMDDIILKRKASELEDFLRKKEVTRDNDTTFHVNIRSAYYHKRPNVETYYYYKKNESDNNDDDDGFFQIGIQIEAGDFRRFIKIKKELKEEQMNDYFDKFKEIYWFGELKKNSKKLFDKNTRMTPKNGKYNKYTTKDYTFIYQYWNIENKEMESIAKDIEDNMKKAIVILNSDIVKKICEIQ